MKDFDIFDSKFALDIFKDKYSMDKKETWEDLCKRVVFSVCGELISNDDKEKIFKIMYERKFIPGGRYLYASGRPYHQVNNCFCFRAEDSREGWGDLLNKISVALMSGGGIGVDYSQLRENGSLIKRTGGTSTGPAALMHMVNETSRYIMQGGNRRSAVWAGLLWKHPDIKKIMTLKNHNESLLIMKDSDPLFPLPMEFTNISVIYDTDFWVAMENQKHPEHKKAKEIWELNCLQAFSTAEPGFSFNFKKDGESLRNACTEVVSEDDSDKCNLGTIWINRIENKDELVKVVNLANKFLLCGGIYSDVPNQRIKDVGIKNNRIGLGIGGIHEWLITRGYDYEVPPELHKWLSVYETESESSATIQAKLLGVAIPKGKRAIAPNGTIGILAESTTGIEPLFCKSYKRKYFKDNKWIYQYVVDGSVKRLIEKGVNIENIKDAYDLTFKQRVKMQADVQNYVDMSISSTCNLPTWGTEKNNKTTLENYSKTLLKYSKRLRGFTCYPDGCRQGQPLERCDLKEALENEGKIFEDKVHECKDGICGL